MQNLLLTFDCIYCSQKLGEDLQNFVAFSKYMNFKHSLKDLIEASSFSRHRAFLPNVTFGFGKKSSRADRSTACNFTVLIKQSIWNKPNEICCLSIKTSTMWIPHRQILWGDETY